MENMHTDVRVLNQLLILNRLNFITKLSFTCFPRGGVLVLTAAGFQICKPWMDKVRLQKEALLTTTNLEDTKDGDLLTT